MSFLPDNFFEHCHMGNSVFIWGVAWCTVFAFSLAGTFYYRHKDAKAAEAEA